MQLVPFYTVYRQRQNFPNHTSTNLWKRLGPFPTDMTRGDNPFPPIFGGLLPTSLPPPAAPDDRLGPQLATVTPAISNCPPLASIGERPMMLAKTKSLISYHVQSKLEFFSHQIIVISNKVIKTTMK